MSDGFGAHVVNVDRKWACASATLPPAALQSLEAAYRAVPWYRDRWTHARVVAAQRSILADEAAHGLILIGPRMPFALPPPFVEFFEPIELNSNDEQLRTLTSPRATRQERVARRVLQGLVLVVLAIFAVTLFMPLIGGMLLGVLALGLLLGVLAEKLNFQSGWHLVPGGMAIVDHWAKAGKKLRLLTRHDTIAQVRWAQKGKTQGLALELLGPDGRRFSRFLSERALLAVLAAWQSPLPPPKMEQLCELAGIDVELGA